MPENIHESNNDFLRAIARVLWEILPPSRFPLGLKTYEYMWMYKVPKRIYERLLSLINKLDFSRRGILSLELDGYTSGSTNVARVIALLVSEWYKRESRSLDGSGAMDIFSFGNGITAQKIWLAAGFPEKHLHRARVANLWQTAMCVQGGFPLVYVNSADSRFGTLINNLSEEGDSNDEDSVAGSWDRLFDDNNSVFSGSLKSGSCKEYVDLLWKYMETEDISFLPFSSEDLQESEFKRFSTLLRDGYGEKLQKDFFKETYYFFTTDESYSVQSQLRIQVGFKKDNHILYASQLEKIETGIDFYQVDKLAFTLKAETVDGSVIVSSPRFYRRAGNGRKDFVSVGLSPLCIDFDIFNTKRIDLFIKTVADEHELCLKRFLVGDKFELYEDQAAYCWITRKRPAARKALLLDYAAFQDFSRCSPIEKRSEDSTSKRPIWTWLYLTNSLELTDVNGSLHSFMGENTHTVQVAFSYSGIEHSIRLKDGGIEYVANEEQGRIKLLYGIFDSRGKQLNISVLSMNNGRIRASNDFILEYKDTDSYRFVTWDESSAPSQGFISIRVSTRANNTKPYVTEVYYIPSLMPVERNLETNTITFNGVSDISMYDSLSGDYSRLASGVFQDTVPAPSAEDVPDTVVFKVGNESAYVYLHVYRSFFMQELIKDGKPKRFISEEKRTVPVLLSRQFSIRTINNEGCQITRFDKLSSLVTNHFPKGFLSPPAQLCEHIAINSAVDVYVYNKMVQTGQRLELTVSPNHIHEYKFFFWTGSRDMQPRPIEATYDEETRKMSLDCRSCNASRGVLFQSLRNCKPYNYYRPYYFRSQRINEDVQPFYSTPNQLFIYNIDDLLFSYRLYREHKTYAAVFSPLLELRKNPGWQKAVLEFSLQEAGYTLSKEDIVQMIRLGQEVGFDWMLLPRNYVLEILSRSGRFESMCRQSLRRLFEASPLVKENDGNNRYERYYFKRIFVDDDAYFDREVAFDSIFRPTNYRPRIDARSFVEFLSGRRNYSADSVVAFIKKVTDYNDYLCLFHDVFYQYVIKQ